MFLDRIYGDQVTLDAVASLYNSHICVTSSFGPQVFSWYLSKKSSIDLNISTLYRAPGWSRHIPSKGSKHRKQWSRLTLLAPYISESCIKMKINLNLYFYTSSWLLKRFYECLIGLHEIFGSTRNKCENKSLS